MIRLDGALRMAPKSPDRPALVSEQRAAHAIEHGYFDRSVVPVRRDDGSVALDHEEFPHPQTTLETLASLKSSFAAERDSSRRRRYDRWREVLKQYPAR